MARRREFTVLTWLRGRDEQSDVVRGAEGAWRRFGSYLSDSFVITAGDVANAIRSVAGEVAGWVEAAGVQEDSVRNLSASLEGAVDDVDAYTQAITENNAAIQANSTFGDELLNTVSALLVDFGVAPDRINAATQAAVDLAAAFEASGLTADAAARLIGRTQGGLAGELGELIPAVKELTEEQLRNGEVVDLIDEAYGGRAAKAVEGFRGQLRQLANSWGATEEALGFALVANDDVVEALGEARTVLEENTEAVGAFAGATVTFLVGALKLAAEAFDATVKAGADLVNFFGTDYNEAVGQTEISTSALEATAKRLGITVEELRGRLAASRQNTRELGAAAREAAPAVAGLGDALDVVADQAERVATATDEAANSARALGVVTSETLQADIDEINEALAVQADRLGTNSREYLRLEEVAAEKVEALRRRIESLRDGQGDLTEAVVETREEYETYRDVVDATTESTDRLTTATERQTAANERARVAAAAARQEFGAVNVTGDRSRILGVGLGGRPLFENLTPRAVATRDGRLVYA